MEPIVNPDVARAFDTFAPAARRQLLAVRAPIDKQALALCLGAALTYHRDKKQRRHNPD